MLFGQIRRKNIGYVIINIGKDGKSIKEFILVKRAHVLDLQFYLE